MYEFDIGMSSVLFRVNEKLLIILFMVGFVKYSELTNFKL